MARLTTAAYYRELAKGLTYEYHRTLNESALGRRGEASLAASKLGDDVYNAFWEGVEEGRELADAYAAGWLIGQSRRG